jgi:2'-5' RNA ligase
MHGIVSLLDQRHATQVAAVWTSLQDRLGRQGMDVPPFPHVSYHVAEQYEVALLEPIVRAFAAHTAPVEVVTTGLGIFTTGLQPVLYITVARHPGLSALQAALWPTLAALSAGIIEYYHPDQ